MRRLLVAAIVQVVSVIGIYAVAMENLLADDYSRKSLERFISYVVEKSSQKQDTFIDFDCDYCQHRLEAVRHHSQQFATLLFYYHKWQDENNLGEYYRFRHDMSLKMDKKKFNIETIINFFVLHFDIASLIYRDIDGKYYFSAREIAYDRDCECEKLRYYSLSEDELILTVYEPFEADSDGDISGECEDLSRSPSYGSYFFVDDIDTESQPEGSSSTMRAWAKTFSSKLKRASADLAKWYNSDRSPVNHRAEQIAANKATKSADIVVDQLLSQSEFALQNEDFKVYEYFVQGKKHQEEQFLEIARKFNLVKPPAYLQDMREVLKHEVERYKLANFDLLAEACEEQWYILVEILLRKIPPINIVEFSKLFEIVRKSDNSLIMEQVIRHVSSARQSDLFRHMAKFGIYPHPYPLYSLINDFFKVMPGSIKFIGNERQSRIARLIF